MNEIIVPQLARKMLSNAPMEAAVLQGLMMTRPGFDEAMQRLDEYCFYEYNHQDIYRTILALYKQGLEVSELTVMQALMAKFDQERASNLIYELGQIAKKEEDLSSLGYRVMVLEELSKRRKMALVVKKLEDLSFCLQPDFDACVAHVQHEIDQIMCGGKADDFVSLPELMDEAWLHAVENQSPDTRHSGLMTGIEPIDKEGGLCEGLTIVGARPSHGKSAFALYLAYQAMRAGKRVAFFSMEMSNLQLAQRLLAMESGLSPTAIARLPLSEQQMTQLDAARQRINKCNAGCFSFDASGSSNFDKMMQKVRALKHNGGLDVVVVDYLQLMQVDLESRDENTARALARASHAMQQLGRDEQLYFLCLSQLNRSQTGIPTRNQLRDSGGIDEAADNVILLYRGWMDHLQVYPSPYDEYSTDGTLLMLLDKNRNGATASSIIGFDPHSMHFNPQLLQKHPEAKQIEVNWESHLP